MRNVTITVQYIHRSDNENGDRDFFWRYMGIHHGDSPSLMVDTWLVLAALMVKMEEVVRRVGINISQRKVR